MGLDHDSTCQGGFGRARYRMHHFQVDFLRRFPRWWLDQMTWKLASSEPEEPRSLLAWSCEILGAEGEGDQRRFDHGQR